MRCNVTSETARIPSVAIQTHLLLNGRTADYRRAGMGTTTILSAGKSLGDKWGLTGNLGVMHIGNVVVLNSFYALALGFGASPDLSFFIEGYGQLDDTDLNFDAGVGYFLNPNLKLDLSAGLEGFGEFEGDPTGLTSDYFISLGLSWRLNWRKN